MSKKKLRSDLEFGVVWAERRALLKGLGKTDEDLRKPQIAVIDSWSDINNGHVHLGELAERAVQGVKDAGGTPYRFHTIGLCDGVAFVGSEYILPSRDLIACEVETIIQAYRMDAMVLFATCDKIVPAYLMAAARLDIPAIIVTGGYMVTGYNRGEKVNFVNVGRAAGAVSAGRMTRDECETIIDAACPGPGACPLMGTANTMCIVCETLGLSLPGNSTLCARSGELRDMAYEAGKTVMNLWEKGITARRIITRSSMENAIRVCMAVGGSSNSLIHIPAVATEAELDFNCIDFFDKASHETPLLVGITPNGPHVMEDFDRAGGLGALCNEMKDQLCLGTLTVTGKTFGENIAGKAVTDYSVIYSKDEPSSSEGALAVLKGNICPDGALVKQSAVPKNLMAFRGPAKVYHTNEEGIRAIQTGEIEDGDIVVLSMMGARGGPGVVSAFPFTSELAGSRLSKTVAMITDGRFSGATEGACIGYMSPEAAMYGPLLAVKDGDIISYDINARQLNVELSDEEIARRLSGIKLDIHYQKGYLGIYQKTAGSLTKGCVLAGRPE